MAKVLSKKIFVLLLLFFVAITFSACASVRTITITNSDGTIDELVYVDIDANKVMEAGYSLQQVKDDVSLTSLNSAKQIVNNFENKVQQAFENAVLNQENSLKFIRMMGGIEILGNTWKDETYYIGLRFKNNDVYKFYYNIAENAKPKAETEEHFLYTEVKYTGLNMFVHYSELTTKMFNYLEEMYPNLVSNNSTELLYTYETETRREHSDANYVTHIDDKYYHTWVVDKNDLGKELTLYYNIANRGNCILVCIGISLVISVALITIGVIVDRKKKRKFKEETSES